MPALMTPQTVLTANDAANQLQTNNLDALGLTALVLSQGWCTLAVTAADYQADTLRLRLASPVAAPFRAPLTFEAAPTRWSDVFGNPLAGPVAVMSLLPEAAHRLAHLVERRLGAPLARPVPVAMVVHGAVPQANQPQAIEWLDAGDPLVLAPAVPNAAQYDISFHDARGLPIDPLAVAALFLDLITNWTALSFGQSQGLWPAPGANGSLQTLVGLVPNGQGRRCHVVDLHGRAYTPTRAAATLKVLDATNAQVAGKTLGADGLVDLAAAEKLGRAAGDAAADTAAGNPLYWGPMPNGTLGQAAFAPPPLPAGVTLAAQFFRIAAVDLDWHLRGHRGGQPNALHTQGTGAIPADDGKVPNDLLPVVRRGLVTFDYLIDGMDTLGTAGQWAAAFPPAGNAVAQTYLASPAIDPALTLPPGPGALGRWPQFPPGLTPANGLVQGDDATRGLTAAYRQPGPNANAADALDVIVTIAAGAVRPGNQVRVYPRRFVVIESIDAAQPSFVRGDGGATLVGQDPQGNPLAMPILLVNPFGLDPANPPAQLPTQLLLDAVVTAPNGQRRLHSAVAVPVGAATAPWADNTPLFGGVPVLQAGQPLAQLTQAAPFGLTAAAPSDLFAVPATQSFAAGPAGGGAAANQILGLVRTLANESSAPREGPRLPTQARFETVLALGSAPAAGQQLAWQALLSGARWTFESRCARPELGDPGNPAGPDLHAAGVAADGQLAYDLALHAVRRCQPIIPVPVAAQPLTWGPGWIQTVSGADWNPPPAPAAGAAGSVSAVLLETVSSFVESPELTLDGVPTLGPTDTIQNNLQALVNQVAGWMGMTPPAVPAGATVANEARLRDLLRRETIAARSGQRDALWSLARALGEAREFVYIEGPAFDRTAWLPPQDPNDPDYDPSYVPKAHELDLVATLRAQMAANPRLKVMICVPRLPDFDPSQKHYVRAALKARAAAIGVLTTQDSTRVAAFHPVGFPGRAGAVRSTVVIVDDVWALVGATHWRRRGLTFDGSAAVASLDHALNARGTSSAIARFRQELLATRLGVSIPTGPAGSSVLWTRLAEPEAAFDALVDLLSVGGAGRCTPVWAGPKDTDVSALEPAWSDPDGGVEDAQQYLALLLADPLP